MSRSNKTQELRQMVSNHPIKKVVYDQEQPNIISISERRWNMNLDDMKVI